MVNGKELSKLWQKISQTVQEKILQPKLEEIVGKVKDAYRRRYYRHVFADPRVAQVEIEGQNLRVIDLSYGGMRIERPAMNKVQSWLKLHRSIEAELTILGEKQKTSMVITSLSEDSIGFSCDPRSQFSLLFLHRYLSYMDLGLSLKALAKHKARKTYQSPKWLSYSNERGTVEIHINMDDQSSMPETHIYCVNGSRYDCVWFKPDLIAISCKPHADLSIKEKKIVLAQTLCILLGMRQIGKSTRLDPYIDLAMQRMIALS